MAGLAIADGVVDFHVATRVDLIVLLRCHPLAALLLVRVYLAHLATLELLGIILEAGAFLTGVVRVEVRIVQVHH